MPTATQMRGVDRTPTVELAELFGRLKPHLRALDELLHAQLEAFEPEIRDLALYCVDASGKRVRPALVFFSGWQGDEIVPESLVRLAAVIEMVHLATLVHDDIMDQAEVRRGRRTASRAFGPDTAVLLGDALFAHALSLASQFPTTEVCAQVSVSTRRVCAGEIMQTLAAKDSVRDIAFYNRVIELKTAELFYVSCHLGARLSGSGEAEAAAFGDFGRHLGTAYQIYDDLADFFGSEAKLGKTLGTDFASGKVTLPLLLLLEKLPRGEASRLRQEIRDGGAQDFSRRLAQMAELGVFSDSLAVFRSEVATARQSLSLARTAGVGLLNRLAHLLVEQAESLRPENGTPSSTR